MTLQCSTHIKVGHRYLSLRPLPAQRTMGVPHRIGTLSTRGERFGLSMFLRMRDASPVRGTLRGVSLALH